MMVTQCILLLAAMLSFASGHILETHPSVMGKSSAVDVYIPHNRRDDLFYNVDIDFQGQALPLLIDTGSADLLVAADTCNVVDKTSGCYKSKTYKTKGTKYNGEFGSNIGLGTVLGNTSSITVTLGGISVNAMSTALIKTAPEGEFQLGSFSGIIGLAPRNVSRNWYFNHHLPLIDEMISRHLLEKPVFSLSFPRLGDPKSAKKGKLTLGGIEATDMPITYNDIIYTPNYNYDNIPLSPQSWTAELQAIRMNGRLIKVARGHLDPKGRYVSVIDSGSQTIQFRTSEFLAVAKAFKGKTVIQDNNDIYFDCSIPQLLELRYHNRWFAVDPLDLIIPSDHNSTAGMELCHAALGSWDRTLGESIIGVPFLRNVVSVYDYVSAELYKSTPRFGMGSTTDGAKAVERYPTLYKNRLQH